MFEKVTEIPAPEKSEAQWNQEVENLNGLLAAANARIEAWKLANMERLQKELRTAVRSAARAVSSWAK